MHMHSTCTCTCTCIGICICICIQPFWSRYHMILERTLTYCLHAPYSIYSRMCTRRREFQVGLRSRLQLRREGLQGRRCLALCSLASFLWVPQLPRLYYLPLSLRFAWICLRKACLKANGRSWGTQDFLPL